MERKIPMPEYAWLELDREMRHLFTDNPGNPQSGLESPTSLFRLIFNV
jgi:hypothetical protein